ncbi:MAG: hypothetical protein WAT39_23565, partial [Planctomycetota bacterium]
MRSRMPGPETCAVAVVLSLLVVGPAPAQDPAPSPPPGASPQERVIPVDAAAEQRGAPVRALTLGDALRAGQSHNVGLRAAEVVPQ